MNDNNLNTNDYGHGSNSCAMVYPQAQSLTEQFPVAPAVISAGATVVKIPVVLAEVNITIPVEADIKLDEEVIEIKRIRKNVYLNQSRIIPFSGGTVPGTGLLFISGFVRKNIEYATNECRRHESVNVCGDIRHCTVEVPFNFTTRITFIREPIFVENTIPSELEFFTDKNKGYNGCSDPVIGRNTCDQSFFFTEFFNEKPFTELVRADIAEIDILKNSNSDYYGDSKERNSTILTEKLVLNLTLKVLQNQQVRVTAI